MGHGGRRGPGIEAGQPAAVEQRQGQASSWQEAQHAADCKRPAHQGQDGVRLLHAHTCTTSRTHSGSQRRMRSVIGSICLTASNSVGGRCSSAVQASGSEWPIQGLAMVCLAIVAASICTAQQQATSGSSSGGCQRWEARCGGQRRTAGAAHLRGRWLACCLCLLAASRRLLLFLRHVAAAFTRDPALDLLGVV